MTDLFQGGVLFLILRKISFILILFATTSALYAADLPEKGILRFSDAEQTAIRNSHTIASQKYVVDSTKALSFAEQVKLLPQLGFGASSMSQSKIGQFSVPALGLTRDVGSHTNWQAGPNVNWVLWDTGQRWNMSKSISKTAESQSRTLEYDKRQVLLNVRTAYINVQFAGEQVRLVREALALARAQYQYVLSRKEAGTADLFDLTVAHQEMVDREKDLEEATGNLAVTKRALVAAMGLDAQSENPDAINVEPVDNVLNLLLPKANTSVNVEAHPQVLALEATKRSSELAARSTISRYFPAINLQGSSTYEYPNLGIEETVQQNQLNLGLGVPILDWGIISKEAKSHKYKARSAKEQKEQTVINLAQQATETRVKIKMMEDLRIANAKVVHDAVLVAGLSFESYKTGKIIFLDVQRANVKALSAKVTSAENDANLAAQISGLLALAEDEEGGVE